MWDCGVAGGLGAVVEQGGSSGIGGGWRVTVALADTAWGGVGEAVGLGTVLAMGEGLQVVCRVWGGMQKAWGCTVGLGEGGIGDVIGYL